VLGRDGGEYEDANERLALCEQLVRFRGDVFGQMRVLCRRVVLLLLA
jgi:hypothetical protein